MRKTNLLTTSLLVLILSGCAGNKYQLPDWDIAQPSEIPVTQPRELPLLCPIEVVDGRGTWSNECWQIFEQYEVIANGNTQIGKENALALNKSEAATKQIIEAAKLQQQLSQIRQELLEEERRAHAMDNWFYRGLIALGVLAAI